MKTILVHYYCGYHTGTYTSIIDLYYNLLKYEVDVELKIICSDVGEAVPFFMDNYDEMCLLSSLTKEKEFNADIIICSSVLLYNIFTVPLEGLKLNANKILILDSLEDQLSKRKIETCYGIIPPLHEVVDTSNSIFLCNPSNMGFHDLETHIYYHKFSKRRLLNIKHKKNILDSINNVKVYDYNRLKRYTRCDHYIPIFVENIGKIIFECIYFRIPVNYSKSTHGVDGLYFYLELFNVDPTINHYPLPISRKDIKRKLFMDDDDLILRMINE